MVAVICKCREFFFHAIFLILFCVGVLIGILLFHYVSCAHPQWVGEYGRTIFSKQQFSLAGAVFSLIRPVACLLLAASVPWGIRVVPILIAVRGILSGYCSCACYLSGAALDWCLLHEGILLPAYYGICRWIYNGKPTRYGVRTRGTA